MPQDENHPHEGDRRRDGVSRRRFFQTVGVTAAGTAVELQHANAESALREDGPKILGPNPVRTRLNVNGRPIDFVAEPATTLLEALRERCDVTGPKEVCDRAACGGCTVLVDATARPITTVEGIGSVENPDPLQVAMAEFDAMQCGFCTPGVVTAARALLDRNPKPSLPEIRSALAGNLCRCGTYPNIFNAVLVASGQPPVDEPTDRGANGGERA